MRLRFSDSIVHEAIDGEVLAIHNETGSYYSLVSTGAEVWSMIVAGASTDQIIDAYSGRGQPTDDEIRAALTAFFDRLVEEDLVTATTDPPAVEGAVVAGDEFSPPTIEVYTDMQELLLFDPIHEVEPSGWPNVERD